MDKKFFALVLISLMLLAGGCGGGSSSSVTDANSALKGAWTSSDNGTAELTSVNSDDVSALIGAFGDLSSTALEQLKESADLYELYKNKGTVETVSAPVTRAMAVFESCDVAGSSGTAKLTAIVIASKDDSFLPVVFNGVTMSTQRNETKNEWTATVPDGTLTISMASDEKMTLSGKVKYLGYDCTFNTVINKNPSNPIDPNTILSGTWNLSGDQGGGYLSDGSQIIAAAAPETVSIFFSGDSQPSIKSLYSLRMRTSSTESREETSLLQNISDGSGTLTNMSDNVYKFTGTDGTESIISVENIDEISVFMLENDDDYGQSCMFLPLKKVSVDVEAALKKTWKATQGGGYAVGFNGTGKDIDLLNELGAFSFSLISADLKFPDANLNDDTITVNIASSFSISNKVLDSLIETLDISKDYLSVSYQENKTVPMTRSGNFLQFEVDKDIYKLSFISDTEAFLSITPSSNHVKNGELVIKFRAN